NDWVYVSISTKASSWIPRAPDNRAARLIVQYLRSYFLSRRTIPARSDGPAFGDRLLRGQLGPRADVPQQVLPRDHTADRAVFHPRHLIYVGRVHALEQPQGVVIGAGRLHLLDRRHHFRRGHLRPALARRSLDVVDRDHAIHAATASMRHQEAPAPAGEDVIVDQLIHMQVGG